MYTAGISPFAELTAEELASEVDSALTVLNNKDDENSHK